MYYATFFQLKESPFSIAPNPRYLFMSERHREALAHLVYGVAQGNGFVALTGEVGTGKTTLCNCLLDQLPEQVDLAVVLNPRVNAEELLATICDELGASYPKGSVSLKVMTDSLTKHLLAVHARGRNTVLLIDEAQNLSIDVLEQIRLLTNLETSDTKLLQIVLVGQPELNHLLAQDRLRQLNQRITARYHIGALSQRECTAYIEHRLQVAGAGSNSIFSPAAIRKVFRYSGGIPRLINIICERAMLGAYSLGKKQVTPTVVKKAAQEVLLPTSIRLMLNWRTIGAFGIGLVSASILIGFFLYQRPGEPIEYAEATKTQKTDQNNTKPDANLEPSLLDGLFTGLITQPQLVDQSESEPYNNPDLLRPYPGRYDNAPGRSRTQSSTKKPRSSENRFLQAIESPGLEFESALPQLFDRWNVPKTFKSDGFCNMAQEVGLRCFQSEGNLNYLFKLNRPAILEFTSTYGEPRFVTLLAIEKDRAIISFPNDDRVSFPISEVFPYWQGKFATLWKPPAPDAYLLARGYTSTAVIWVRRALAAINGRSGPVSKSVNFDRKLEADVTAFQLENGLTADGIVGAETMILLNNYNNSNENPKLIAKAD